MDTRSSIDDVAETSLVRIQMHEKYLLDLIIIILLWGAVK